MIHSLYAVNLGGQRPQTPCSTPIRDNVPDFSTVQHLQGPSDGSPQRVGGGFNTDRIAAGVLHHQHEARAQYMKMDETFNAALSSFMQEQAHAGPDAPTELMLRDRSRTIEPAVVDATGRQTFASANKTRLGRAGLAARNKSKTSTTGASFVNRSQSALSGRMNTSKRLPNHTMHCADASCCGYRDVDAHASGVKGLFVTFCHNSIEQQLLNATRELEHEKEMREMDRHYHQTELAKMLRKMEEVASDNATMKSQLDGINEVTQKQVKEIAVLKEAYETKYREEREKNENMIVSYTRMTEEMKRLEMRDGSSQYQISELIRQLAEAKEAVATAEKATSSEAMRCQLLFSEKEALRAKCEDLEKEQTKSNQTINAKDTLIAGLEKELKRAQEKLSSVAFFKESFGSGGKAVSGNHAATQSKIYQKFYSRKQ